MDLVGLRAKVGARDIALGVLARTDDLKAVPRRIIQCIPSGWHTSLSDLEDTAGPSHTMVTSPPRLIFRFERGCERELDPLLAGKVVTIGLFVPSDLTTEERLLRLGVVEKDFTANQALSLLG